ncbi:MAG: hypothetical protein MHM6MM_003637 [Cercozoa sp. M6MM]
MQLYLQIVDNEDLVYGDSPAGKGLIPIDNFSFGLGRASSMSGDAEYSVSFPSLSEVSLSRAMDSNSRLFMSGSLRPSAQRNPNAAYGRFGRRNNDDDEDDWQPDPDYDTPAGVGFLTFRIVAVDAHGSRVSEITLSKAMITSYSFRMDEEEATESISIGFKNIAHDFPSEKAAVEYNIDKKNMLQAATLASVVTKYETNDESEETAEEEAQLQETAGTLASLSCRVLCCACVCVCACVYTTAFRGTVIRTRPSNRMLTKLHCHLDSHNSIRSMRRPNQSNTRAGMETETTVNRRLSCVIFMYS